MTKIAIFSDLHIGVHQNSSFWLNQTVEWVEWFKNELDKNHIDTVFFCGDWFHYRDEVSLLSLDISIKILDLLKDKTIYMITGNHDCYYKETSEVNSLTVFKGRQNIHVIDNIKTINFNNKNYTFCPWGTQLKDIPESDIVFGHFELSNFRMNAFKLCEEGDDPEILITKAPLVFSGHFHSRDEKKYDNNKTIIYIGNPFEMDFGDTQQRKGYYILDTLNSTYSFHENAFTPKHIKIYLSKLVSLEDPILAFEHLLPNNIIMLIIDKNISTEHLDLLTAKLTSYKPLEIRVDYDVNYNKIKISTESYVDMSGILIEKAIEEFVNMLDIQNKKEVIDYTVNLLQKAKI